MNTRANFQDVQNARGKIFEKSVLINYLYNTNKNKSYKNWQKLNRTSVLNLRIQAGVK